MSVAHAYENSQYNNRAAKKLTTQYCDEVKIQGHKRWTVNPRALSELNHHGTDKKVMSERFHFIR